MEKTHDQMEGQKKDFRLLLGLIPIALIVWLTLGTIDTQMRVSLTSELQTVLDTTRGGLRIWAAARKAHITAWAESNNVRQAVAVQLQLPRTAETLRRGPALKALRMLLNPAVQQDHSPLGFAVVAPDGVQVAAAVDELVGGREVQRYDPTSITRAFTGATTLGVPFLTTTEVDLGNGVISPTESPAMIVASPVRDARGTVIAVLTFFLDPDKDFTRITQLGRMGRTGETYAFDRMGRLVTESRFDRELRAIGLIPQGNSTPHGILGIEIRDPGGNMLEGFRPTQPRAQQPLTRMAQNAVLGISGLDIDGYRDYRGVPVVGAWTWDQELEMGLTTEIDVAEAYHPLTTMRTIILAMLVVVGCVMLIVVLMLVKRARTLAHSLEQQRRVEDALRNSEARTKLVIDTALDAVIEMDIHGCVREWNRQAEVLFGWSRAEILGQDLATCIIPERFRAAHRAGLRLFVDRRQGTVLNRRIEVAALRRDGREIPIELALTPQLMTGEQFFTAFVRDITERRQAQAILEQGAAELNLRNVELAQARDHALAATQSKSTFLATMSHEIRTPMNAIVGMADLLLETSLTADQQDYVHRFSRAATVLLKLVNDILDTSKIEAGQLTLETIPFDPADLLEETAELMAVKAQTKQLELILHIDPTVPSLVMGDPTRLGQILINLIGNAVKFTARGAITIYLTRETQAAQPGMLHLSVSDSGIGIPSNMLRQIFEDFTQVDSTVTRRYGGTGLGLGITKRLVELMGGDIWVESVEGVGSTFHALLCLPAACNPEVQPHPSPHSLTGKRILVVDAHATNRLVVRELITAAGGEVLDAPDGPSALSMLAQHQTDEQSVHLIILDRQLPGMEEFEVVRQFRATFRCDDIPVMVLTSNLREKPLLQLDNGRPFVWVRKPLRRRTFLNAVQSVFDPASSPSTTTLKSPASHSQPAIASDNPIRVLLADDVEDNRDLIALYLKGTPYQLDVAENGAEAVQKFQSQAYDLVLMDIQVPVMDGYQATAIIRTWEVEGQRARTPIVALTANAFREEVEKSLLAGCDAHLTKPIKKQTLLTALVQMKTPTVRTQAA